MSVNVRFASTGKYNFGKVEIDGTDVSNHVMALEFRRHADGSSVLTLHMPIHGEDTVDLGDIPGENVTVHQYDYRREELATTTTNGVPQWKSASR